MTQEKPVNTGLDHQCASESAAGPLVAVFKLASELCDSVDAADEDIGGHRSASEILGDLGPAVEAVKSSAREHPPQVPADRLSNAERRALGVCGDDCEVCAKPAATGRTQAETRLLNYLDGSRTPLELMESWRRSAAIHERAGNLPFTQVLNGCANDLEAALNAATRAPTESKRSHE